MRVWREGIRNGCIRIRGKGVRNIRNTEYRIHHLADVVKGSTFGFSHFASFLREQLYCKENSSFAQLQMVLLSRNRRW